MTKKHVRIPAGLMAGVMILFVACGCGQKPSVSGTQSAAAASSHEEQKPVDLEGYEFILASHWNDYEIERGSSAYGDATLDLLDEIRNTYHCKITIKTYPNANAIASEVHTSVMAGDKPFDVLDLPTTAYTALLQSGDLYDQSRISTLQLDNGLFNETVTEMGTWNGKIYGSWFGPTNNIAGMFFNADMLRRKNLESPYDLYEKDEWTFSKLKEMLTSLTECTNGDGIPEIYGIVGGIDDYLLYAGGGGYVLPDGAGGYTFGLDMPSSMAAVEYVRSLYQEGMVHPEQDWMGVAQVFAEGGAAFLPYFVWANQWFGEMEDEYGFLPFPRSDNGTQYISYTDEPRMYVMPKNLPEPEKTGIIYTQLSRLAEPATKNLEQSYKDMGFTEKGIEYFHKVSALTQWNPANGVDVTEAKLALYFVTQNGTAEPASKFAEVKSMIEANIQDYYNKLPA